LTAVLRTKTLPVYDPWYSHGALNYYYGGWFVLAAPARLLRTAPALVMNLAMAVFASVSAGAVFSLGAGAASVGRTRWRRRSRRVRTAVTAGLLSAGFVLLLANAEIVRSMWERLHGGLPSGRIDWWGLSRVIPNSVAITEFPAWSLLFGDVHPHVMGIGVIAAVGALCLAWYAALVDGRRAAALVLAVMLGVGIGLTRMTNTWDFPLAVGITVATSLLALAVRVPWRRLVAPAVVVVVMVGLLWSPYVRRGEVFDAGFEPSIMRTPPSSWLRQFGFFAAVTVVLVGARLAQVLQTSVPVWRWITRAHLAVVAASVVSLAYLWRRPGFETFEITLALAVASIWVAWDDWRGAPRRPPIAPLLLGVGWGIQAGVEMLSVRNDAGRQNTVFKFWYESWIALAIACAVVIAQQMRSRIVWLRRTSWILAGCALVMAGGFWMLATPVRMDDRISDGGLSLDGEAYLTDEFVYGADADRFVPADDMPLVDWLRANVRGIHVEAEAPGNDYKWTGRISWLTGLPTPIGWSYHESQQRRPYGASLSARHDAMTQLYTTTDVHVMANVLSRYDVEYVVFGTQEHLLASPESEAALRSFECLTVVASADRTTESGVEPGELFVATVDPACVNRLRPSLPSPPPTA
jgi:YYY domain-containing protein